VFNESNTVEAYLYDMLSDPAKFVREWYKQ